MTRNLVVPKAEASWDLTPNGPLVLVYVGAFYGAGRFFGVLFAWLADRLGIAKALGISLNQKEMRDELEPMCGLAAGSFYLCVWFFALINAGAFL